MAKRLKDLGDWEVILHEDSQNPSTPSRRSRRGQSLDSQAIKIHRQVDDTTLVKGDSILISEDPRQHGGRIESFFGVIVDMRLGIQSYLEIEVAPFVNGLDISDEKLPDRLDNELLLTCETHNVLLGDFVEKVLVLSQDEYDKVAKGELISSTVFVCHKATDRTMNNISSEFDYKEWLQLLHENKSEAISFLADKTLIIISPKKSRRVVKSLDQRRQASPSPSKRTYNEDSDSDDKFSDDSQFSLSSDENEDPEAKVGKPTKVSPRKRAARSVNSTPKKKARDIARETDAFQQVMNVLSPVNKGFKVKTNASVSSLPSLARTISGSPTKKKRSSTSEAFRELREKLHTSTRINLLPCREEQFEELYMNLESAVMEGIGCCLYVSGTPGVGKTATIREAIASLRDSVDQGYMDDFDYLEINSLKLVTPAVAYEKLWEHLTGIKVTSSNASLLLEEYFGRKDAGADRRPLIVVLDELDQLVTKNQNVIYNFFNWPTYPNSKLVVIAIANTMDLPERILTNKIASRLGLRRYGFRGYTEEELGIIIEHRLTLLREENKRKVTVSLDAMSYASKKVALVSGDARRALTICRRAVEIAEREYLDTTNTTGLREEEQTFSVRISHIGKAISETINSPLLQCLSLLPFASKLVLTCILLRMRRLGLGEIPLGEIVDEVRNSLSLFTSKNSSSVLLDVSDSATYLSLLLGEDPKSQSISKVRVRHLEWIVSGLVEQGILLQQNVISQRYRMISLNVFEEDIVSVLRKDADFATML